jgi:hypothetical protein
LSKAALTQRGWRKRSGDIYTIEVADGVSAWLGLNRASKHQPLLINLVAGVRHEATMQLCDEISQLPRTITPTLSDPIRVLSGKAFDNLRISALADAPVAAQQLLEAVENYALPFAHVYMDPDQLLAALRRRDHLPVSDYAIIRLPAMLTVLGRFEEALSALDRELHTLHQRSDPAAVGYRASGAALRTWIAARS